MKSTPAARHVENARKKTETHVMALPTRIQKNGLPRRVSAVAMGVKTMMSAGLMLHHAANAKSAPNSRCVYFGHVRCACWKMSRTKTSNDTKSMKRQNAD